MKKNFKLAVLEFQVRNGAWLCRLDDLAMDALGPLLLVAVGAILLAR